MGSEPCPDSVAKCCSICATCYSVDHWSDQNIYWSIALQAWTTSNSLYLAKGGAKHDQWLPKKRFHNVWMFVWFHRWWQSFEAKFSFAKLHFLQFILYSKKLSLALSIIEQVNYKYWYAQQPSTHSKWWKLQRIIFLGKMWNQSELKLS